MAHITCFLYFLQFWLLSRPCVSESLQERHLCYYRFTVSTVQNKFFPEFSAAGACDDKVYTQYSYDLDDWINGIEPFIYEPYDPRGLYKNELKSLSNCTQCSELHILQRIIGCELERFPNGSVKSLTKFDEYGFDGEDLIGFDYDTMKWIGKSQLAKKTKEKWDLQTGRNQGIKNYLETFMDFISKYKSTNISFPDVRVLVSKAPDNKLNLTCHVTGFYPKDIEVYIRLDDTILEDQMSSGVRPNADKTFQMRNRVTIDRNHGGLYDCVVIHSSLTEPMVVSFKIGGRSRWIAIGVSIAVAVSALLVIGYIIYKERQSTGRIRPPDYGATELNIQLN